jgi:hypothetical protein
MQSVKVRRSEISADQAADILRSSLGGDYQVQSGSDGVLLVRKGLARAKVSMRTEPGGTVFDVSGEGISVLPLLSITMKMLNDRGIARRTATVIGEAEALRGDS